MTDHPRACGEHNNRGLSFNTIIGSSPRVRGTRRNRSCRNPQRRIIPARAGNTCPVNTATSAPPDHPRACGEHGVFWSIYNWFIGSSPRVRGTRAGGKVAGEGEHNVAEQFILHTDGSSPRVRGTQSFAYPAPRTTRIIPARAGEHSDPVQNTENPCGSSPRVRGTRY